MRKFAWAVCAVLLIGSIGAIEANDNNEPKSIVPASASYVAHAPIRINSNSQFDAEHGVSAGNGTQANPWIIQGWDINGTGAGDCIYVGNTTEYFKIRGCSLHNATGPGGIYYSRSGVELFAVKNGAVEGNIAINNLYHGVCVTGFNSSNITVAFNNCSSNSGSGIAVFGPSRYISVLNNTCWNNLGYGVNIAGGFGSPVSWSVAAGNVLARNAFGLQLAATYSCTATSNSCSYNTQIGLRLQYVRESAVDIQPTIYANVSGNFLYRNKVGIYDNAMSILKNRLFHNSLILNKVPAYDLWQDFWDNGYPSGGNYWDANYTGVDSFHGANQNQPGADGMGDTPYAIDSDSIDHYPLMVPFGSAASAWTPDVRITNAANASQFPDIAANGSKVYLTWGDKRNGVKDEVYFASSTDNGLTWSSNHHGPAGGANPRINEPLCANATPSISLSGDRVHLVWHWDGTEGMISYSHSDDAGTSWSPRFNLSTYGLLHYDQQIAAASSKVYTMWSWDDTVYWASLSMQASSDNGVNWGTSKDITSAWYGTCTGLAVNSSTLHVISVGSSTYPGVGIYYFRSRDGGATWSPWMRLTHDATTYATSIAVQGSTVHILYNNASTGNKEVYYLRSLDDGTTWDPPRRISDLGNDSYNADIAVDGNKVFVVWQDDRDNNGYKGATEIYYAYSTDNGATWSANQRLTYSARNSTNPSICVAGNKLHLAWQDNRSGPNYNYYEIYYKSLDLTPQYTYNIPLVVGWNLVSLPLSLADKSVAGALSSITGQYDGVMWYNASNSSNRWQQYRTAWAPSLNDLTKVDTTMGIWLHMTFNGTLSTTGRLPSSTSIQLKAGWNLVGYPSLCTNMTVGNAFWGTGADIVEVFDSSATYKTKVVGPTYVMKPGEGYWVHVPADAVWTVNW